MALDQTRPYEESTFVDDESISNDELWFLIDNSTFDRPKKIARSSLPGGAGGVHIEKDRLTGLSSNSVSVTFATAFSDVPYGDEPKVYRTVDIGGGKYRREDVLFYFSSSNWLTASGFSLTIDASESLTNVVVEYVFV